MTEVYQPTPGVAQNIAGWVSDPTAGFVPPNSVGKHVHGLRDLKTDVTSKLGGSPILLAQAQVTTNQGSIGTTDTVLTGLSATVTVPAGRTIRVSARCQAQPASANATAVFKIRESGAQIGQAQEFQGTAGNGATCDAAVILSPSAGTHTYDTTLLISGTGGTMLASGTNPAYIAVEDVTGSPLPYAASSVPVGVLAENWLQANVALSSTEADGPSATITVPAGRLIKITGHGQVNNTATAAGNFVGRIREVTNGNTEIGRWGANDMIINGAAVFDGACVVSPSAGAHTYKLTGAISGTSTGTWFAPATVPDSGRITVEDITPTPAPATTAPSNLLGQAQATANQGSITSEVALSGLAVTVTVPAGRTLKITGRVYAQVGVANDQVVLRIKEGSTQLQSALNTLPNTTGVEPLYAQVVISPSAGTHTYSLTFARNGGTGTETMVADPNDPAFIMVEDITPTSVLPTAIVPGELVANSSALPSGPSVGTMVYEPDTGNVVVWNGAAWVPVQLGVWTTYTPSWTSSGTQPTVGNGTLVGRYMKIGRLVIGNIFHSMGSTTTVGTGNYTWSLPFAPVLTISSFSVVGQIKMYQGGTSASVMARIAGGTQYVHGVYSATWPSGTETNVGATTPFTFTPASGPSFDIQFAYEATS